MAPTSAIETAVDEYVKHIRPDMTKEFKEWRDLTDEVAVERAALGLLLGREREASAPVPDPACRSSEEPQAPARQPPEAPRGG